MTSELRFETRRNAPSNDHEVRILVDGVDWIGPGYLGIDPPELFSQLADLDDTELVVGRCLCGCLGCGDLVVRARSSGQVMEWIGPGPRVTTFDLSQYRREVSRFGDDHSWEDVGRQAERLVGEVFRSAVTEDGFGFDWASTRIRPCMVHLSFSKDGVQKLLDFSWDGETMASALQRARSFHKERIDNEI